MNDFFINYDYVLTLSILFLINFVYSTTFITIELPLTDCSIFCIKSTATRIFPRTLRSSIINKVYHINIPHFSKQITVRIPTHISHPHECAAIEIESLLHTLFSALADLIIINTVIRHLTPPPPKHYTIRYQKPFADSQTQEVCAIKSVISDETSTSTFLVFISS